MQPGFKALKLYKGDTFAMRLNVSSTVNNSAVPFDITGYTFTSQIKEKNKSTLVAEFTYNIEDAEEGQLLLILSADEANKLNASKKYEYDVQMNNDGSKYTILQGPIIVTRDISS